MVVVCVCVRVNCYRIPVWLETLNQWFIHLYPRRTTGWRYWGTVVCWWLVQTTSSAHHCQLLHLPWVYSVVDVVKRYVFPSSAFTLASKSRTVIVAVFLFQNPFFEKYLTQEESQYLRTHNAYVMRYHFFHPLPAGIFAQIAGTCVYRVYNTIHR